MHEWTWGEFGLFDPENRDPSGTARERTSEAVATNPYKSPARVEEPPDRASDSKLGDESTESNTPGAVAAVFFGMILLMLAGAVLAAIVSFVRFRMR